MSIRAHSLVSIFQTALSMVAFHCYYRHDVVVALVDFHKYHPIVSFHQSVPTSDRSQHNHFVVAVVVAVVVQVFSSEVSNAVLNEAMLVRLIRHIEMPVLVFLNDVHLLLKNKKCNLY
jgi:hypothetical protein